MKDKVIMKNKLLFVVFLSFISSLSVYGMGDKNNQNSMGSVGSMRTENVDLPLVDFDDLLNDLNVELHASGMVRVEKSVNIRDMIDLKSPSSSSSPRSIARVLSGRISASSSEVNNTVADYDHFVDIAESRGTKRSYFCFVYGFESNNDCKFSEIYARNKR